MTDFISAVKDMCSFVRHDDSIYLKNILFKQWSAFLTNLKKRRNVNHVRKIFKTMRYEQRKNY